MLLFSILIGSLSDFDVECKRVFRVIRLVCEWISSLSWLISSVLISRFNWGFSSFVELTILRNWSSFNCLNIGCLTDTFGDDDIGIFLFSSSSSSSFSFSFSSSLIVSSIIDIRRRDTYSCECSSSSFVIISVAQLSSLVRIESFLLDLLCIGVRRLTIIERRLCPNFRRRI